MFRTLFFVFCVSSAFKDVQSDSTDDLKAQYVKYIMECSESFKITSSDLEMLRNKQMPNSKPVKCVFACAYKKAGIMDEAGYLSVEKIFAISEKYLSGDSEKIRKAKQFAEACQTVNFVDLNNQSDIECERAALIFECSLQKAPQFDFIA